MLSCIIGKTKINIVDHSEIDLRLWSNKGILKCPICGEKLIYKNGLVRIPHFAHEKDSECKYTFFENETKEHYLSKIFMYKKLKNISSILNLKLEHYIPETKQRPDLYFEFQGLKYVIECQCSPITLREIKERKDLYKLNNIIDIWIFGTEKFKDNKPIACQNYLENYLVLNPFKEDIIFRKINSLKRYKTINNFTEALHTYKNMYYETEKYHKQANKINEIVNYLYNFLEFNNYSIISNSICNLLAENNEITIRIEPNDSKKKLLNIIEYFNYIIVTGKNDVYLRGSETYKVSSSLFEIVNNRGEKLKEVN